MSDAADSAAHAMLEFWSIAGAHFPEPVGQLKHWLCTFAGLARTRRQKAQTLFGSDRPPPFRWR